MDARIPTVVAHADFQRAIKPLTDLLGTAANEIVGDIHIVRTADDLSLFDIRFTVVAPPITEKPGGFPTAVVAGGHPQGDTGAIWAHQVNVTVSA